MPRLAVACPGLRTLVGTPRDVAHALQDGTGGITCLRLGAERNDSGSVQDVVAAVAAVHARLPRLQLQRREDGSEWWTAEEVAGLAYDVV